MKKYILILAAAILLLISCSQQRNMARRFVKQHKKAVVALYLPNRLIKNNLREDIMPAELENASLEEQVKYMQDQIKVVDKIDDDRFLDIIYASMKEALEDYGLTVRYWNDDSAEPDSMHWIINIPRIEIRETGESRDVCRWLYSQRYCVNLPVDMVNVASWFELADGTTDALAFTEQDYFNDTDMTLDFDENTNRVYARTYVDTINIDGFYRFGTLLGRLYAGYCYDFMMYKYVDRYQKDTLDTINRFRYDPYERYLYKTECDYLIEIK